MTNETKESETQRRSRLRWVTLGEAIAITALVLSGLGLWHEWNKASDKAVVVEQRAAVPLTLRGKVRNEGKELEISPIEGSHVLQSLSLTIAGAQVDLGSDGELDAHVVKDALGKAADEEEGRHSARVRIAARYVEAGADKSATGSYVLTYKIRDRLIGGKSLRLVSLSR